MNSSLEHIPYEAVCSPEKISYKQFRSTLTPLYSKVWFHISAGYVLLSCPFIIAVFIKQITLQWWLTPLWAIWFGYFLAYLHLFVHEAAHFNIHPDKKQNDRLANIFLCVLFALDMKSYRSIHWQHHLHLAAPDDKEVSYFNALTFIFLLKVLSGFHTLHIVLNRRKSNIQKEKSKKGQLLRFVLAQTLFCSLAYITGNIPLLLSWLAGLFIVFPFLATLRQILEHRDESASNQPEYYSIQRHTISRLFGRDIISRTFGGAGFNRHILHHWDPQISYTRLNDVLMFLRQSETTKDIIARSRTSYLKTFRNLFYIK